MSKTARDVMSKELLTVTPATSITDFARLCSEDRISGAPVVRVDGVLVGIVSKTDLIDRLLADGPKFGASREDSAWDPDDRAVEEIMQEEVLTCDPRTPLPVIAEKMAEQRIHRVVVIEKDRPVGIVTSIDLLRHFPTS
ncbi:MAG: CBS domain-containing protein [Planctomycetes bacterium]|nr:CBS domain-containing protein [Planctomycetota bacterium]